MLGGLVITSGDRQSRPGYIVNPTVLADDRKVILLAKLLRGPSKKDMSSVMVHMKTEMSDMVPQSLQRTGRLSMRNDVTYFSTQTMRR